MLRTSRMLYIMTLHTTNVLSFQDQGQYKDNYYQQSQLKIRFLYPARVYLLMTTLPDSIPVSIQGTSEEFEDPIPVSCQGVSVDDYTLPDSILVSCQGTSEEFKSKIRFLYLARVYLLTTNSRLDSCILPGHV